MSYFNTFNYRGIFIMYKYKYTRKMRLIIFANVLL